MFTCPNCGKTHANYANFCDNCGYRFVAPSTSVALQPVPVRRGSQKNIVGMVMSLVGLVSGILSSIYGLFGLLFYLSFGVDDAQILFAMFGLIFALIAIPFSIVGLNISTGHIRNGSTHKTATLGKTFGTVAVIISAAVFLLSIILLITAA